MLALMGNKADSMSSEPSESSGSTSSAGSSPTTARQEQSSAVFTPSKTVDSGVSNMYY